MLTSREGPIGPLKALFSLPMVSNTFGPQISRITQLKGLPNWTTSLHPSCVVAKTDFGLMWLVLDIYGGCKDVHFVLSTVGRKSSLNHQVLEVCCRVDLWVDLSMIL